MIGNIYLLEKALEREVEERQASAERARRVQLLCAPPVVDPSASPAGGRVLLRIGRLVLAWAVPPS
jgi:hypothetical protein